MEITCRNANFDDASLLLSWRNSPEARKYSLESELITSDEHMAWFSSRLLRIESEPFLIFFWKLKPIGTVRLDFESFKSKKFLISIFVDPTYQGVGIGNKILTIICEQYLTTPEKVIIARVQQSNIVSKKLFVSAGFKLISESSDFILYEKNSNETS